MINTEHYFDWAATTPADSDILHEALDYSLEHWGNPSSMHQAGVDAHQALDETRERCAKVLGVSKDTLYFTSGGTEGDHIPLLSMLTRPQKGSIAVSSLEHPALREMAKMVTNCGWRVITIPSDKNGFVTPEAVINSLEDDTVYVTVMAVNNETGAIQPIYDIADALVQHAQGKRKPFFHVDCVQAAGKIPLDLTHSGIDSACFSAHKICGPRGIGLLYSAKPLNPFLRGGGQEKNIRSGTENLFGARAFALCLEKYYISISNKEMQNRLEAQKQYAASFISGLHTIPTCTLIPHARSTCSDRTQCSELQYTSDSICRDNFSPWVVQAAFRGIPGQVMVRALNAEGFFISTGSACSASKQSRPILDAMSISADEKDTAVRFSFGAPTTLEQMNELLAAVKKVCAQFNK